MATYKLIQDIEAEDHILGPLTLRQFLFALVAVFLFYICFLLIKNRVAFLLVLFLPPALFCGFFALPFGTDQPTEIWALAKLRFWFKPRRRIWNQSGVKDLVTITVPKKVERVLTKNFSQNEVQSRLQALATTIDSRGWAIKHVDTYGAPHLSMAMADSDRLIDIGNMPQEVPNDDVTVPADDILDETSNPIARQFDSMITQSSQDHRQRLINEINDIGASAVAPQASEPPDKSDNWFMGQGQAPPSASARVARSGVATAAATTPGDDAVDTDVSGEDAIAEDALSARLADRTRSQKTSYGNLRTMKPLRSQPAPDPPVHNTRPVQNSGAEPMTAQTDPAIISLAKNNDLNVSTLAREAHKAKAKDSQNHDEVVIPLH